jgi:L-alanine-DL-glutamate epimerase-like enolase superfamily enzyme
VDISLYDLKAKILGVPVTNLLGEHRNGVDIYGSGGFTSYSIAELQEQLSAWVEAGISRVKMKIGREPDKDLQRIKAARRAIGKDAELFVDANGGYAKKQALKNSIEFLEYDVRWFEEPVSSDDLEGLRFLRERIPAPIEVTAGEYGYDYFYFKRMLDAQSVDVLQADATRCGGITGFLKANTLCEAFAIPLSAHTAPLVHMHCGCATRNLRHIEYFHDHVRIEKMFFEGFPDPVDGKLFPDKSRSGLGIEIKAGDIGKFSV